MSRKRLGMTAMVDADDRLLGVFTDGDLRRALDDAALDLRDTPDRRADGAPARAPSAPDQLAVEAAHLMETLQDQRAWWWSTTSSAWSAR